MERIWFEKWESNPENSSHSVGQRTERETFEELHLQFEYIGYH